MNCFLCEDRLAPTMEPKRYSLQSICRYLNIKLNIQLSNYLTVNTENLSVTLCEKCASVSLTLSDLCTELELLHMKIGHSLHVFYDVMKKPEVVNDQCQDQGFPDTMKVGQDLRKMIKEKCHFKLNSHSLQTPLPASSLISNIIDRAPENKPDKDNNASTTHEQEEILPNIADKDDDDTPNPIRSLFKSSSKCKTGSGKLYICKLCNPPLKMSAESKKYHNIRSHIDTLLTTDYKLPNLPSKDFKLYCDHIIKVEAISTKKQSGPNGTIKCHCSYCPKKFSNFEYITVHLYLKHEEIIGKKLTELQKSSTVDEIKSLQLPTLAKSAKSLRNWDKHPCTLCTPQTNFSSDALPKHRIRLHLDYLLRDHKSPNTSQNDFKIYCDHVIEDEVTSCQKTFNKKGSSISHCAYCKMTMSPASVKAHLYTKHKEILVKKLVELQNSTKVTKAAPIKHQIGVETPEVSIELESNGHQEDLSYHSGNIEFKDEDDLVEMEGIYDDSQEHQHQMDVEIEEDGVLVKMEYFSDNMNDDPLQF